MAYEWTEMRKPGWDKVKGLYENGGMDGYSMIYPDRSEGQIESRYDLQDIEGHHLNGGNFGDGRKTTQDTLKDEVDALACSIAKRLIAEGFIVQRHDAHMTNSIYLELDYGICNYIRIDCHAGKEHLKCRYNIGPFIDEFCEVKDGYGRLYYRVDKAEDMVARIIKDRDLKLSQYGYESYAGFILKNERDKEDSLGFWREAF